MPTTELVVYVQAAVRPGGGVGIAYEPSSAHRGRGLGTRATRAMIDERIRNYNVRRFVAVAKAANFRSLRTLARLGFSPVTVDAQPTHRVEPDEVLMFRAVETA